MNMKIHVKDIVGKMKLADAIHLFSKDYPGTIFYLGSSDGSGFYFIGNAEEFDRDIEDLSKSYEQSIYNRYVDINEDMLSLMRRVLKEKDFEKQTDMLVDEHEKFIRLKESANKYACAVKSWLPIQERIVTTMIRKNPVTDEPKNGVIIHVKGIEDGKYWFYHEYITKKVVYESTAV